MLPSVLPALCLHAQLLCQGCPARREHPQAALQGGCQGQPPSKSNKDPRGQSLHLYTALESERREPDPSHDPVLVRLYQPGPQGRIPELGLSVLSGACSPLEQLQAT